MTAAGAPAPAPTAGPEPAPAAAPASAPSAGEVMVRAQLDLSTDWHFWGVLTHRDGRIFAGRIGGLRIFGAVMVRVDVPAEPVATYGIHPAQVADWVVASEGEARQVAAIVGLPGVRGTDPAQGEAATGRGGADVHPL